MTMILKRRKIAYFPAPKVACTSIKHFLFEIRTGKSFEPFVNQNGKRVTIHTKNRTEPFDKHDTNDFSGLHRFTVVRDPVKRLLSAYSNRVIHHKELSEEAQGPTLREAGLPIDPDLETFISLLPKYCEVVNGIRHHTKPLTHFLGTDPGFYNKIYKFSELSQMQDDINAMAGTSVVLKHRQRGGPKLSVDDVSTAQIDWIRNYYASDYDAFGDYLD